MRFKLIHVIFFHLDGMDLINFVDQLEQLSYKRGEDCTTSISIKETNMYEKHLITADKSSSLLLIFSKNLSNIKTAKGFHKVHGRASHATIVKVIYLDLSFHRHT